MWYRSYDTKEKVELLPRLSICFLLDLLFYIGLIILYLLDLFIDRVHLSFL